MESAFLEDALFECAAPGDCGEGWGCVPETTYTPYFCAPDCDPSTCDGACVGGEEQQCIRGCFIGEDLSAGLVRLPTTAASGRTHTTIEGSASGSGMRKHGRVFKEMYVSVRSWIRRERLFRTTVIASRRQPGTVARPALSRQCLARGPHPSVSPDVRLEIRGALRVLPALHSLTG